MSASERAQDWKQNIKVKTKKCYKLLTYSTLLSENLALNSTQSRGRTGTGCPTGV